MNQRIDDPDELADAIGLSEDDIVSAGERTWSISRRRAADARGTALMIAGLGMHRIEWSAELLMSLRARGYDTLTVDNHDAGASLLRDPGEPYSLHDLALDLVGLLDALGLDTVHAVGISMGGMLAQHFALAAADRTASLTSISSTTGRRGVGRPAAHVKWVFTTPLPVERVAHLDYVDAHHRSITSESHRDPERARWLGERVWDRGLNAAGYARQLAAIGADGDRTERLHGISAPTLVLHGDDDPMIDVSGGRATADAIPGSRFITIPGMGHVVTWHSAEPIAEHLVAHFDEASTAARVKAPGAPPTP